MLVKLKSSRPNLESQLPDGVMTTGSKSRIAGLGYRAVVERFPQSELATRRLLIQSEPFREMCEELAEAETILSKFSETTHEHDGARKEEWQAVVDRLVAEVAASLRKAKHEQAKPD